MPPLHDSTDAPRTAATEFAHVPSRLSKDGLHTQQDPREHTDIVQELTTVSQVMDGVAIQLTSIPSLQPYVMRA